jgi:hypothetical protein
MMVSRPILALEPTTAPAQITAPLSISASLATKAFGAMQGGKFAWTARNRDAHASRTAFVKVCGCRPDGCGGAAAGGRRTQTSKGGNRGRLGEVARQRLWGFRRWRFVADARSSLVSDVSRCRRSWSSDCDRRNRYRAGAIEARRPHSMVARGRGRSLPAESRRSRSVVLQFCHARTLIMMCRS